MQVRFSKCERLAGQRAQRGRVDDPFHPQTSPQTPGASQVSPLLLVEPLFSQLTRCPFVSGRVGRSSHHPLATLSACCETSPLPKMKGMIKAVQRTPHAITSRVGMSKSTFPPVRLLC